MTAWAIREPTNERVAVGTRRDSAKFLRMKDDRGADEPAACLSRLLIRCGWRLVSARCTGTSIRPRLRRRGIVEETVYSLTLQHSSRGSVVLRQQTCGRHSDRLECLFLMFSAV